MQETSMGDPINPQHYKTRTGLEAIQVIEAFWPDDYHLATAFKYLARCGKKGDPAIDLQKAIWYLQRKLAHLQKEAD